MPHSLGSTRGFTNPTSGAKSLSSAPYYYSSIGERGKSRPRNAGAKYLARDQNPANRAANRRHHPCVTNRMNIERTKTHAPHIALAARTPRFGGAFAPLFLFCTLKRLSRMAGKWVDHIQKEYSHDYRTWKGDRRDREHIQNEH